MAMAPVSGVWIKAIVATHVTLFTSAYFAWKHIYEDTYDDDETYMLDEDGNIVYREKYVQQLAQEMEKTEDAGEQGEREGGKVGDFVGYLMRNNQSRAHKKKTEKQKREAQQKKEWEEMD